MKESKDELAIFSKNVAYLRKNNNLTAKEMASVMGISEKSLLRIENGQIYKRLSVIVIFKLAHHFKYKVYQMFEKLYM